VTRSYGEPQTRARMPIVILAMPRENAALTRSSPVTGRVYFPEPGKAMVVAYGDFQPMLSPQIAHPERLRDSHRLLCFLQIYEALTRQPAATLAAARFQPLTTDVEAKLAVPPAQDEVPPVQPGSQLVLPHQRFFRLRAASDPTRDRVPAVDGSARRYPPPLPKRRSIPERYLTPWELRVSREEALYDMKRSRGLLPRLAAALRPWLAPGVFRKWRAMLAGKSADDQLFAVRPPEGGLSCEAVREWASYTLAGAGYDPDVMLTEWEIFWRRKSR
jgi:hypothetical protein